LASLIGSSKLIVLVNKLDAHGWSEDIFNQTVESTAADLGLGVETQSIPFIPISGLHGDNLIDPSSNCPWYTGWVKQGAGGSETGKTLIDVIDIV
ncbi:elongation factor 1 alpha, partial [Lepidopterella palustris CBS 459.81]